MNTDRMNEQVRRKVKVNENEKKQDAEINEKIRWPYFERGNMSSYTPSRVEIRLLVDKNHFEGGRAGSWRGFHLLLYLFWGNSIIICMQIIFFYLW